MENNTNERLGSDTRTQDYNTTENPIERCLHPFCSPLVDGEIDLLTLSNEELNAMGLLHIGDSSFDTKLMHKMTGLTNIDYTFYVIFFIYLLLSFYRTNKNGSVTFYTSDGFRNCHITSLDSRSGGQ